MIEHFLNVDMAQALSYVDYEKGYSGPTTDMDAAANISGMLAQAVSNCDLRGLNDTAAELSFTKLTIMAVEAKQEELGEDAAAWIARDEEQWNVSAEKRHQDSLARAKRNAEMCEAQVHLVGRSVGFRQCTKRGNHTVTRDGLVYRACGTHVKDFKPFRNHNYKLAT